MTPNCLVDGTLVPSDRISASSVRTSRVKRRLLGLTALVPAMLFGATNASAAAPSSATAAQIVGSSVDDGNAADAGVSPSTTPAAAGPDSSGNPKDQRVPADTPPAQGPSPYGSLGRAIWGDAGPFGKKISLLGWVEGTAVASSSRSKSILPAGFLMSDKGASLNQAALVLCSGDACPPQVYGPSGGGYARIGPFPGPKKEGFDIGFNITMVYGADAQYFTANGFETDFGINKHSGQNKFAIPQAFVDVYVPFMNGTHIIAGDFFTSVANEIGLPFDPPDWFATRTHAFAHGPARHFGVVADTRLYTPESFGLVGVAYGLVNGWNTQDNPNGSWDFLGAIHYRSPDMKTWVDFEMIYGNGRGEENTGYFTETLTDRYLKRYDLFVVINRQITPKISTVIELNYGHHDGGDIAPLPIFFTGNAHWGGANGSVRAQISKTVSVAGRVEWFTDPKGAQVTWAQSPGAVWALTANTEWMPSPHLRIRPEVRYDTFNGKPGALPLFDDHRKNDQLLAMLNVFVPF